MAARSRRGPGNSDTGNEPDGDDKGGATCALAGKSDGKGGETCVLASKGDDKGLGRRGRRAADARGQRPPLRRAAQLGTTASAAQGRTKIPAAAAART